MSVVNLPSPLKLVSRLPLLLKRASPKSISEPYVHPATTILPSAWMAIDLAPSVLSMVTIPSASKLVSRLPSLL